MAGRMHYTHGSRDARGVAFSHIMKQPFLHRRLVPAFLLTFALLAISCGDKQESSTSAGSTPVAEATSEPKEPTESEEPSASDMSEAAETDAAEARPVGRRWTEEELHKALLEKNPAYNGLAQFHIEGGLVLAAVLAGSNISDISPLAGMPLLRLDLQNNAVRDLSALKGAPLIALYLDGTTVDDLSPIADAELEELYLNGCRGVSNIDALKGQPLKLLNLFQTGVHDLSPLRGAPLESLWLNETPVSDISALAGAPLVTITLYRTQVTDLSPLAKCPTLQRIHCGETPVTDLSPLKDLVLTRLIFPPNNITKGLDEIKKMASLSEVGVTLEQKMWPTDFWQAYDAGAFKPQEK